MPYTVKKGAGCPDAKPYAVVKTATGEKVGCHATPEAAGKQIAAIEHSEKEKATHEWSERMRAVRIAARPDFNAGYVRLYDPMHGLSQEDPVELVVEVARDDVQRKAGLRWIEEPPLEGMLFVYDTDVKHPFTCREVEFDLDIFWFDGDGNLVGTETAEAHRKTPISVERDYRFVLEVPAGTLDIPNGYVLHSQYDVWTESSGS